MAATKYTVKAGDTLNSIAQQYGYKDYKEAGITSVPSGDFNLIRPGETIEFNGSSSNVGQFSSTPIVTSLDSKQQFDKNSTELDKIVNAPVLPDDINQTAAEGDATKTDTTTTTTTKTGDKTFDAYRESADAAKLKAQEEADGVLKEYDSLYKLELAAIDAKTKATVNSLKESFAQRIEEQKRINTVNVDRVKAYGLASGSAQYMPIMWSDAITERERKGAEEIKGLERERQNLIDLAKAAQREGNAALLEQRIKDYNSVKDKLNKRLGEIETESQKQYEMLRKLRQEQEAEFQKKKDEAKLRLQAYYRLNKDEVENLTPDEKEALVNTLSAKYGFENYEVLGVIEAATAVDYDALKSEAEIAKINAQTGASNASAAAAYALAAQRNRQTQKLDEEPSGGDYTDTESRQLRQAGLSSAPQNVKDDFLYGDLGVDESSVQDYLSGNGGNAPAGDVKSRAANAGYDYEAMKAAGYSDDDIKAALDEAGV